MTKRKPRKQRVLCGALWRAMRHHADRIMSITEYAKLCPVTMKPHDWRAATDAPGRVYGDACVRCKNCQMKALDPTKRWKA